MLNELKPRGPFERLDDRYQDLRAQGQRGWYDGAASADSLARWHRVLGPHLQLLGGHGLIVEFGSGAGELSLSLASLGFWVVGFDVSPSAVNWAQQKADFAAASASFEVKDLGEPFELLNSYMGACDLVLDGDCYHYMIGSRRRVFLDNAHSLLAPSGGLVLRTTVGEPSEEMWESLGYRPSDRVSTQEGVPMTYHAEVDEVLAELASAGFRVESQDLRHVDPWKGNDILTVVARLA